MSALLGALAAMFTFLAAREVLPRPPFFAAAAGLLVAYQPMFTFISGAVNNDVGINAAAAATVWLLMRVLRRGASLAVLCALGVLLGALPVIKGTGYELYPIAAIALLGVIVRARGARSTLVNVGVVIGAGLVVQLVWSQLAPSFGHTTFTTPGGGVPTSSSALSQPGLYLTYVWQIFLPRLPFMADHFIQRWPFFDIYVQRGWASFGWYTIEFPRYLYGLIVIAMGTAVVLGIIAIRREWPWVRTRLWELVVLALLPCAVIAGVESAFATNVPRVVLAEMGRYLFPAISALAILTIGATVGVGRRRAVSLATGVVVAEFVLVYASQLLELRGFYT
jgi:4-amino-4-deoxy-L-arabinose transferase-like glycosyltransferase